MSSKILELTETFVKGKLKKADPGHDFLHVERVRNNAKLINKVEKGDWFIIELAVLLHDVGDRKILKKTEDDYTIARKFLNKIKVDKVVTDRIMYIIENVSFHKGSIPDKNNKEFCVVQDADRLDGIGAIGIGRTFTYGGSLGRPLYGNLNSIDQNNPTTYDHFEEKLFLLRNLMNTEISKKIAKDRHDFMKVFIRQLLLELKGKK